MYPQSRKRFHAELNPDELCSIARAGSPSFLIHGVRLRLSRPLYSLSPDPPIYDFDSRPRLPFLVSLGGAWIVVDFLWTHARTQTHRRPHSRGKLVREKPVYIRSRARHARKNRATLSRSFDPVRRRPSAFTPLSHPLPLHLQHFANSRSRIFLSHVAQRCWDDVSCFSPFLRLSLYRSSLYPIVFRGVYFASYGALKTQSFNLANFPSGNLLAREHVG